MCKSLSNNQAIISTYDKTTIANPNNYMTESYQTTMGIAKA